MAGPLIDQNSNLVRYEIRVNQSYYDYIKDHSLYLRKNVPAYPAPPVDLPMSKFDKGTRKGTYGVIEVKAAWRLMKNGEDYERLYRLRKTCEAGVISATLATNERLLEIIVELFRRGEVNKIRLANKAISQFEATEFV